jgi:hypothetical protein
MSRGPIHYVRETVRLRRSLRTACGLPHEGRAHELALIYGTPSLWQSVDAGIRCARCVRALAAHGFDELDTRSPR